MITNNQKIEEMSINLNFWVRPSQQSPNGEIPIFLNISYDGTNSQYSLGLRITPSSWDKKSQKVKGKSGEAEIANNNLVAIRTKAMNIYNDLLMSGEPFNAYTIKDRMVNGLLRNITLKKVFEEYLTYMKKLKNKEYSQPTIDKYQNTFERVNEFVQLQYKRVDFYLYELDYNFVNNFSSFLRTKYDNSNNTIYKQIQRLSKVIRVAINKGYLNRFPFTEFKIKHDKKDIVYLTIDEIKRIEDKKFNSIRMEQVKHIFLLSCFSGLSFKELENLRKDNIFTTEDGTHWLTMQRQKTKKQFRVVMLPQAIRLIEDLQHFKPTNRKPTGFLPMLSNQKYNSYLKEIADQCGIGKVLSSHVGRKSYCNLALQLGLGIDMVSKLLGHSSIAVTMSHYNAISEERMVDDIKSLSERLNKL